MTQLALSSSENAKTQERMREAKHKMRHQDDKMENIIVNSLFKPVSYDRVQEFMQYCPNEKLPTKVKYENKRGKRDD